MNLPFLAAGASGVSPPGSRRSTHSDSLGGRVSNASLRSSIGLSRKDSLKQATESFDRDVALDHVSGTFFSEKRRGELARLGAGYRGAQYGLRTAQHRFDDRLMPGGLRFENEYDSRYQRDAPNPELDGLCQSLDDDDEPVPPGTCFLYINSAHKAEALKRQLKAIGGWWSRVDFDVAENSSRSIVPGLYRLACTPGEAMTMDAYAQLSSAVGHVGARPSLYQLSKQRILAMEGAPEHAMDPEHSNLTLLDGLARTNQKLKESAGQTANWAANVRGLADLVEGLNPVLQRFFEAPDAAHDQDLVLGNALESLTRLVRVLPTLTDDSSRFISCHDAIMDDLHLVLAVALPYPGKEIKSILADLTRNRLQGTAAASLVQEGFLFSSGMDALSTAIEVALDGSDAGKATLLSSDRRVAPDYYEALKLSDVATPGEAGAAGDPNVFVSTLNPSTSQMSSAHDRSNKWDVEDLVRQAAARIGARPDPNRPLRLIVDNSIEKRDDLRRLMDGLAGEIESGAVTIILAKSLMKGTAMGSGKLHAGGVTVISADPVERAFLEDRFRSREALLDWGSHEESQLTAHMLRHAGETEFAMLENASRNLEFVEASCFRNLKGQPNSGFDKAEPGIPLPILTQVRPPREEGVEAESLNPKIRFSLKEGKARSSKKSIFPIDKCDVFMGVPFRDSFAFLESTKVDVDDENAGDISGLRFSIGQESEAELVEKFFASGQMHQRMKWSSSAAIRSAHDAVQDALAEIKTSLREDKTMLARVQAKLREARQEAALGLVSRMTRKFPPHSLARLIHRPGERDPSIVDKLFLIDAFNQVDDAAARGQGSSPSASASARGAAKFALNKMASLLIGTEQIASLLTEDDRFAGADDGVDRMVHSFNHDLDYLREAVLKTGMSGLSMWSRRVIVDQWFRKRFVPEFEAGDPVARGRAAEALVATAAMLPYPEDKARLFKEIPDGAFDSLGPALQERLTFALFAPLDSKSKRIFLDELSFDGESRHKAETCERVGGDIDAALSDTSSD